MLIQNIYTDLGFGNHTLYLLLTSWTSLSCVWQIPDFNRFLETVSNETEKENLSHGEGSTS